MRVGLAPLFSFVASLALSGCPMLLDDEFAVDSDWESGAADGSVSPTLPGDAGANSGDVDAVPVEPDVGERDASDSAAAPEGGAEPPDGAVVGAPDAGAEPTAPDATPDSGPDPVDVCQLPVLPGVFPTCPAECTGGCAEGLCHITCEGKQACKEATVSCPPGVPCQIRCSGEQACEHARLNCRQGSACSVSCDGKQACKTARIECGAGPCDVACADEQACDDSQVKCGPGACHVTGSTGDVACDTSCSCTTD